MAPETTKADEVEAARRRNDAIVKAQLEAWRKSCEEQRQAEQAAERRHGQAAEPVEHAHG